MRYLLFVFFLIVVIVFAHASHRGTSERLGERLMQAVSGALQLDSSGRPGDPRYRDVEFEVSHLDIILKGRMTTREARAELVDRIRKGTAVGRVRYRDVMLLEAEEPELAAVMVPGKVTLEGRIPSEELAMRIRRAFQPMGIFVSAQNLVVDDAVNAEPWLEQADAMLARFFEGTQEGEFVLRDGVLRVKRAMEKKVDLDFLKAEVVQWLPAGRFQVMDELVVAQTAPPVELSLRKLDSRWIVTGHLPDQPALDSILRVLGEADAAAAVDGAGVTIDAALTRPRWLQDGRIERFLKVFVSTVQGNPQVIIRGDGVQLMGTARNFIAKSNLPSFAGEAFGYGTPVDDEGVRVAESGQGGERWLRFDVNPSRVVITGAVGTEEAKRDLASGVARAFPAAELRVEGLLVDGTSPAMPWLGALGSYFADLAALTTQGGTLDLSGKEAFLGGIARTEWSRDALVGKLEQALGPEFLVYDQLLVDPRGEVAPAGEAIKIYFGLGARKVGKEELGKIEEAAQQIQRVGAGGGSVVALVKGYASPGGSADYNIKLSEDRAMAVYEALIGKGVNPRALKILNEGVDSTLTGEEARRVEIFIR